MKCRRGDNMEGDRRGRAEEQRKQLLYFYGCNFYQLHNGWSGEETNGEVCMTGQGGNRCFFLFHWHCLLLRVLCGSSTVIFYKTCVVGPFECYFLIISQNYCSEGDKSCIYFSPPFDLIFLVNLSCS